MTIQKLCTRLSACESTKNHYGDVMHRMHNACMLSSLEFDTKLTAEQCAIITYLSAATTKGNRDAAIALISKNEPPAWCEETEESIIKYMTFLMQDTWRPFMMVDHMTFWRSTGAAINVNESDTGFMRRFIGCLPLQFDGKDMNDLTGLDITLLAAEHCGDRVGH